jgi:hypothetical protein
MRVLAFLLLAIFVCDAVGESQVSQLLCASKRNLTSCESVEMRIVFLYLFKGLYYFWQLFVIFQKNILR